MEHDDEDTHATFALFFVLNRPKYCAQIITIIIIIIIIIIISNSNWTE